MLYSISKNELRERLNRLGEELQNQLGKGTKKPSMKWIYRLFHGIQVLTIEIGEMTKEIVINLDLILERMVGYYGEVATKRYAIT